MTVKRPTVRDLQQNIKELERQLHEYEDMLRAIREGEVDAIVVSGSRGEQVFSLFGAESIYRLIVETMQEAALTATFDGKILYCNTQFAKFLKTSPDQIIGHSIDEFVAESDRDSARLLITIAPERPVKQRLVFQDARSEKAPAHVSASVLDQPNDASICIVVSDLTELENSTEIIQQLRNQREALRQSEEKYRTLFSSIDVGFCIIEVLFDENEKAHDYRFLEANPAFEKHTGIVGGIGRTIREFVPNQDAHWFEIYGRIALTGVPERFESFGEALGRFYEVYAFRVGEPAERKVAVLFNDISARKKAEQALRDSEEKFRTIIESSKDGINMLDLKTGRYVFISPAQIRITGFSAEELQNMLAWEAYERVHPDERELAISQLKQAAAGLESGPVEYRWKVKSGEYRWFSDSRSVIRDSEGQPIALVGISRDITQRKIAEQQLKELNDTLENRVAERTFEAEKRAVQLRQLAADLTLSEQRERQRLAMVLHDGLQQTLVAAKFSVALLERGGDVEDQAAEISGLIDDCIETSRSLTAELSPPILYKGGLVPALEWLVKWMREKHGLAVKLVSLQRIERAPEEINVLLFQAVRELLFNVVKHSGVKTASVEVGKINGNIQVEVADQGAGFDVDRVLSTEFDSGGMGLFSINERISYLGGKMEIESAPGKGSRFRLVTPPIDAWKQLSETPSDPDASVSVASWAQSDDVKSGSPISVVLVDDHIVMRQGLAGLLQAEPDIKIVGEASDGEAAVTLVRKTRPDVILMDISLPGMDGIQATRAIHREMPDIKIIGLSMFHEGEQAEAIREAGAVNYLTKTGPSYAVVEAIRACLQD